jgi:class 3 adenylate cyclase
VRLNSAQWRTGFRGPVTQNNGGIAVALVEVGDLLDDLALVSSARTALEDMYARGVMVVLGWPALVPHLLAIVARHEDDLDAARRYLDHAFALVDRERLTAERARVLLERSRLDAATGAPRADVAAGVVEAARIFDQQSMHGWAVRCDELAQALGLPVEGVRGTSRERTIFTDDVVGSTAANAQLGDALYLEQLRIHDRLVRARLREFRGLEIKHTGDGLNAAFDHPDDAMHCALAALDDMRRWRVDEPELALQIRCGLARGPLIPSGGDFFGLVQSQAARLCNLAAPGELLATAQVVEGFDSSGVRVDSVGSTALRGLPSAIEVFRVRLA